MQSRDCRHSDVVRFTWREGLGYMWAGTHHLTTLIVYIHKVIVLLLQRLKTDSGNMFVAVESSIYPFTIHNVILLHQPEWRLQQSTGCSLQCA